MSIQLVLKAEQLEALCIIRELGNITIEKIVKGFSQLKPPPMRPRELRKALADILPDLSPDNIRSVVSQLMSIYALKRQHHLSNKELLDGLLYGFRNAKWTDEQIACWRAVEPQLDELFSLGPIATVVKTLELSFDYENVFYNSKIITDIRPIFNENASKIEGILVSYILRLYYDSADGNNKNMSIALDQTDVENLLQACERALKKAKTAKEFTQSSGIQGIVISEDDE
jgi:hypothetical protein